MIIKKIQYSMLCCITAVFLLISGSAAVSDTLCNTGEAQLSEKVYVGGMPFGVRFQAGEVVVVRTNSFASGGESVSPAEEAGILANDVIQTVNGQKISSIGDIVQAVAKADGSPLAVAVRRGEKEIHLSLIPKKCDTGHAFRLGVMLKDSSAGIGTVTFVQEDSPIFAGLGHGICDNNSGKVLKIESGYITNVKISDVHKGTVGTPGELCGNLEEDKCGKLLANTEVGVYGIFTSMPENLGKTARVADMSEVQTGDASIRCTLENNVPQEYAIKIMEINHNTAAKTKNYLIKVTDERLLAKTGGIVQGMSGSPILQNGKLIGAITHVMINDPTTGYGIYIGNMLSELKRHV